MGAALPSYAIDVVVVGSANTDLTTYVARMPRPGETVQGQRFCMNFGGKGANQAVAARLVGAEVAFVAKLGSDSFGDTYLSHLQRLDVDTSCVLRTDEASTGTAPILVDESGENCVVVVPGANALLSAADIADSSGQISAAKVLICQGEVPLDATLAALRLAHQKGLVTILNPAPATPEMQQRIVELMPFCSIVCPNETELALLTGLPVDTMDEVEAAAAKLEDMGCSTVLVTLGSRGAFVTSKSLEIKLRVTAPKVDNVVNTVGAGDAFCGALAAHLSQESCVKGGEAAELPPDVLEACIERACFYASLSVQADGAQESYTDGARLPREFALRVQGRRPTDQ